MKKKNVLLNGLALLVGILFFMILEGALRLFNVGDEYPLFIEVPAEPDYLYQNPEVARRYFKTQQQVPGSQRDYFKAEKDSNTFRIVVQGGSSAAGYPLYYGGSFSRMLEQRLLQSFPGKNIEVINTAMAAVNSYTLRDLVPEIIEQEPDLVLIYAGHNEYYGSLGVGSSESLGRFVGVVNMYLSLQNFRVVQVLERGLIGAVGFFSSGASAPAPGSTLMSRMVEEQEIPYGSVLYDMGINQFRKNMGAVLSQYQEAGIPVLISTLASNEKDQPPFISNTAEEVDLNEWEGLMREGVALLASKDTLGAIQAFDNAIALDSIAASSYYARGQVLFSLGRAEEARAAFLQAKDRDQLRFRAPEEINQVIRDLAATSGAGVVESRQFMRSRIEQGIIGQELMLEHLHPNVEGYFMLADAFYEAIRDHGLIGEWKYTIPADIARNEILFTRVDSLVGEYRVQQLMNSWPFQPHGTVGGDVQITPESEIEHIAYALYKGDLGWYEATNRLRSHYESTGDLHNALRASLAVIQEYPFIAPPYLSTGDILFKQGRVNEALNYIAAGNEREETAAGFAMEGTILLNTNKPYDAIEALEKSIALEANDPNVLFALTGAYLMAGRSPDAKKTLERLLAIDPNHREANLLKQRFEQGA